MAMNVDLDSVVARAGDLVESRVDDDIVMMSVETGRYYGLSDVAARAWELLAEPTRVSALCDKLLTEYRVERPRCEVEVLAFVRRLAGEGLARTQP